MPSSLTVREAAQRLGLSELAVYRAVQQGLLPHFRVGTRIRFDREALEEWIQSGGSEGQRETAGAA